MSKLQLTSHDHDLYDVHYAGRMARLRLCSLNANPYTTMNSRGRAFHMAWEQGWKNEDLALRTGN